MSVLVYDALTSPLKVHDMAEKEGGFFFNQLLALAAVCTNNHQVAQVSNPDYSVPIRALTLSPLCGGVLHSQTKVYLNFFFFLTAQAFIIVIIVVIVIIVTGSYFFIYYLNLCVLVS